MNSVFSKERRSFNNNIILQNKLAVNPMNSFVNQLSHIKKGGDDQPEDRRFLESNTTKPSNLQDSIMMQSKEVR